jgi:hypothetical protein
VPSPTMRGGGKSLYPHWQWLCVSTDRRAAPRSTASRTATPTYGASVRCLHCHQCIANGSLPWEGVVTATRVVLLSSAYEQVADGHGCDITRDAPAAQGCQEFIAGLIRLLHPACSGYIHLAHTMYGCNLLTAAQEPASVAPPLHQHQVEHADAVVRFGVLRCAAGQGVPRHNPAADEAAAAPGTEEAQCCVAVPVGGGRGQRCGGAGSCGTRQAFSAARGC